MSGRGACLDNAVVEAYIRYYNQIRLHTSNDNYSPIEFEQSTINVSYVA